MNEDGGRGPGAMDLPSPLAGEGQGGGAPAFPARTGARVWPLRSLVRCVKISPTPSGGSGLGSAAGSLRDSASGDRLRSVLMSWISRVSQPGWSLKLMVASTAGGPSRMLRVGLGSRLTDSTSCASGTTRCLATWRGCWRRFGRPCRIERQIDPPPRPSPARGEGIRSVPHALRDLCNGQARAQSGGDDRMWLLPGGSGGRWRGAGSPDFPPPRGEG
jgi:hypothetical protein